jgi:hypothetical protein
VFLFAIGFDVEIDLVQQQMSRHIQDVHQIPKEQLSLDPLVNLNTLLTGALPLEHGIRSSRWKESQKIVSAYVSETSGRLLGNIMDGSRQLFTEAPLTVSLASSKQLAYSSLTRDSSDKVYGFLENGAIQSSLEGLKYSESEINGEISRIAILFNIRASSVSIGVDEIGIVVSDNKGRVRLSFEVIFIIEVILTVFRKTWISLLESCFFAQSITFLNHHRLKQRLRIPFLITFLFQSLVLRYWTFLRF